MGFFQVLIEAFRAMSMNRLRAGLTMLGIIIGVGAVVLMLAIGESVRADINQRISAMGSNLFIVFPGTQTSNGVRAGRGAAQTLTQADAQALAKVDNVEFSAPILNQPFQLVQVVVSAPCDSSCKECNGCKALGFSSFGKVTQFSDYTVEPDPCRLWN